ncbi:MAG: sigma 54-interacting transcriptional regulator [Gemmatimonadota bacterium]|jgi:transcriptional regulator with PAS, ATPase and Fis domain
MPDTSSVVLISTHDLRVAGLLRDAFRGAGYRVELVTPDEDLSGVMDPVLFIFTGGLKNESSAAQARQARGSRHIPVFGLAREGEEGTRQAARALDLQEVFTHPPDVREILLLGRTLIERNRLQEITGIVGETDSIREALERVVQFAPVEATVLVTGESGTGKELIARGIHALSPRKHKSFIAVNVAALAETLLESELFGHEKGAFTGAIDSRRGLFELAQGGTIFLDEIGEMPLSTQTKLLRVLEEREFFRVGGERPIRVDVRIIAATNQELRRLVERGDFRRDLYFRLNVLRIELPALRDRKEDIPLLVHNFIEDASRRHDRQFAGISDDAMKILVSHTWPGNVRELRNLVESMVVLAPGRRIEARDIPAEVRNPRSRGLLPAPIMTDFFPVSQGEEKSLRPELEFVFRTLVNLRMDVDDLRRDFERYQEQHLRRREVSFAPREDHLDEAELQEVFPEPAAGEEPVGETMPETPEEAGAVLYRPGMTMEEVEEETIRAVLEEVGGNRRKAAERLEIGERTLYRKIKKFGLEG